MYVYLASTKSRKIFEVKKSRWRYLVIVESPVWQLRTEVSHMIWKQVESCPLQLNKLLYRKSAHQCLRADWLMWSSPFYFASRLFFWPNTVIGFQHQLLEGLLVAKRRAKWPTHCQSSHMSVGLQQMLVVFGQFLIVAAEGSLVQNVSGNHLEETAIVEKCGGLWNVASFETIHLPWWIVQFCRIPFPQHNPSLTCNFMTDCLRIGVICWHPLNQKF